VKPHPTHVQFFTGNLIASVIRVELVGSTVDLLAYVPRQPLVGKRWQPRQALLSKAGSQLSLPLPLLTIPLVSLR